MRVISGSVDGSMLSCFFLLCSVNDQNLMYEPLQMWQGNLPIFLLLESGEMEECLSFNCWRTAHLLFPVLS